MRMRLLFLVAAFFIVASPAQAQLTAADVQRVINQAAKRANRIAPHSVIAVTNREGYVLGVWNVSGGQPGVLEIGAAVSKAGTAAFLSSNANAFTSRTAGFIIQQHFPPGVRNLAPGPLVGVGFSNLPFSDVNRFKRVDMVPGSASPGTLGSPVAATSLSGIPGGVPLYKNGVLVGGVGVVGTPITLVNGIATTPSGIEFPPTTFSAGYAKDEDIALVGQQGFAPSSDILASNVFIAGISLPYVESSAGSTSGAVVAGNGVAGYGVVTSPPPFPYPTATFSGVSGQIRQPIIGDPLPGTINGQARLTQAEVEGIVSLAADRVRTTRAGIRLPIGTRMEVFITVVNNPNMLGVGPTVLAAFRTGDATIFSWDVAVQKARTAVAYSINGTAYSTRTVGFLAQSNYPPGIDPNGPGPFNGMQEVFSGFLASALPRLVPAPGALLPPFIAPDPMFPNGITIFPGGFPLYRNGQLIGAIGISGDGVDQDDIVSASGTSNFLPPDRIRADQFNFSGTRLPYAKFPRDPNGINGITPVTLPTFTSLSGAAELANISVRVKVETGERLMIGGFIMTGDAPKRVIVRAIGPSLLGAGISNALVDPALEIHDASGASMANDLNWQDAQGDELRASGLAPANDAEAALVETMGPGAYTASMTAQDGGTGVGLLELYDADPTSSTRFANVSARGMVGAGDDVMIGGFIVRGQGGQARLIVRAIGPSLASRGISEPVGDPRLEIRDGNGALLTENNDWRETQEAEILGTSLAPSDERESAAMISLGSGAYTAILQGSGGLTGIGLLEIFKLP